MAAKISELRLTLSSYPYLRSAMVRFPLHFDTLTTNEMFSGQRFAILGMFLEGLDTLLGFELFVVDFFAVFLV